MNKTFPALTLTALVAAGCLDLHDSDKDACRTQADCLGGFTCVDAICRAPGSYDAGDGDAAIVEAGRMPDDAAISDAGLAPSDADVPADDASTPVPVPSECTPIRVNAASTAAKQDGKQWSSAFSELQDALKRADTRVELCGKAELWLAAGRYAPSHTGDRNKSFVLVSHVAIYGGFAGSESARSQRDPALHVSLLTADLLGNDGDDSGDTLADDSYTTLVAGSALHPVDESALLDGVAVHCGSGVGGYASCVALEHASVSFKNVAFLGTSASAPMLSCLGQGAPTLIGTIFTRSRGLGGVISLHDCTALIDRLFVVGNIMMQGAAIDASFHDVDQISNAVVAGNGLNGAGAASSDGVLATFVHSDIVGNFYFPDIDDPLLRAQLPMTTSIAWGNPGVFDMPAAHAHVSCIEGEPESGSNVDCSGASPFRGFPALASSWTAVSKPNPITGQTTLRDSAARWKPGALAGLLVAADADATSGVTWCYIASNTEQALQAWGHCPGPKLHNYQIYDLRPATGATIIDTSVDDSDHDILGHVRFGAGIIDDDAGTEVLLSDIGAYEYTPAIGGACLADCD